MEGHCGTGSADYAALSHAERIDALAEIQRRRNSLDADEQRLLAAIEDDPTPDVGTKVAVLTKHYVPRGSRVRSADRVRYR